MVLSLSTNTARKSPACLRGPKWLNVYFLCFHYAFPAKLGSQIPSQSMNEMPLDTTNLLLLTQPKDAFNTTATTLLISFGSLNLIRRHAGLNLWGPSPTTGLRICVRLFLSRLVWPPTGLYALGRSDSHVG